MANKANQFYFDNFVAAAEHACNAANYLLECMEHYEPQSIKSMLEKMHTLEHAGDGKKHEMSAALAKAFVTPVDREDLALISQNIDEVTDCIEEILQRFYVNRVQRVLPDAIDFAKKLIQCCEMMKELLKEFVNFKKQPAKLHDMIVNLSHTEEDCDALYLDATMRIQDHCTDILEILAWREIYNHMEDCADACEHVGDCVETVVMKNT